MKPDAINQPVFKLLLACNSKARLSELVRRIEEEDFLLFSAETIDSMERQVSSGEIDLVIVDSSFAGMSGLATVHQLALAHPFIPAVLISDLEPSQFHHRTEGLGVLMQLQESPGKGSVKELAALIRSQVLDASRSLSMSRRKG